ncbi:gamma-glutamylcyclotransferase family protein [Natrinema longum]|uniref:Gamma-glutamylcyclotransferase n=1 Tax=Natrinema longum TaxID=370324 RepID=A0A8A2UEA0_9EURY|nr:gamma-glutamylcyclotransferase family protein [Natrinema longum]MBZ6494178.1 gamma-glutamylcyclotransferase [Natrinema longum]QSW87006.1 gamma-glutamylcyclotransferase [Natrinema longum]
MLVFVYGTLTDPARVTAVLELEPAAAADRFVDHATLEGLHRVDGRYPTLVPGGSVDGRLLAVDGTELAALDRYEGVERGLYVRVAVPMAVDDGGEGVAEGDQCWAYVGKPDRLDVVATWPGGGSFRERVRSVVSRTGIAVRTRE